MSQTHENRTGISQDCKVDVVTPTNLYDQEDLEPSGLHGVRIIIQKNNTISEIP